MKNIKTLVAASTILLALQGAMFASADESKLQLLTLDEVRSVWNGRYKYESEKDDAIIKIMDRMRLEHRLGTNQVVASEIENYLLDEISKTKPASADDCDSNMIGTCHQLGFYLKRMSEWGCMKEKENLMKVAATLAQFKPMPDLETTDAMKLAWQVDNYMKYGTNAAPRRSGLFRRWDGPTTERVFKITNFRKDYNRRVDELHHDVLARYQKVITGECNLERADKDSQTLWNEFVRVSGGIPATDGKR